MAHERLKNATLPHALSDVLADIADLFQRELRLAKAELFSKLSTKIAGGVWMAVAGVVALIAAFILLQAVIFAIASFGLAMHWACLIVAVGLAIAAGIAFMKGRAAAEAEIRPDRTIHQIKRDISTAKEQLT